MPAKRKRSSGRSTKKVRPRPRRTPQRRRSPLDANVLEVLNDTQTVAEESPQDNIDRKRGTILTGGDVDAAWDEVDVGEETVGGSTPTPDQDVVDDLGRAAGVTYSDSEPLRPEEKEMERDEKRWEMDPASSPDYQERQRALRKTKRRVR
ncbi:MAG TPA: DUF6335 family protein [Candidatus Binatia bacterium]|nr:DUF6335 family protein [Candidatus Binatia bacterium]